MFPNLRVHGLYFFMQLVRMRHSESLPLLVAQYHSPTIGSVQMVSSPMPMPQSVTYIREKGKTSYTTAHGVGLSFGGKGSDRNNYITEIVAKGSAHRDGAIEVGDVLTHIDLEAVHGLSMEDIRERILGAAGTKVKLTIQKATGAMREVTLTRGSPEWWSLYDDNENMRKVIGVKDKEIDILRKKLHTTEHLHSIDREELDKLQGQLGSLERIIQKQKFEVDREVDLRRRAENMVNALTAEKKHLDDQVEGLFKKVSEVTLSFKSAQGLARDLTEKSRQSEQGRLNEEKLRKLAEAREAKSQSLLLEEITRRKDAETETLTLQARMQAIEAQLKHQDELVQEIATFSAENHALKGRNIIIQNDVDSTKAYVLKMQEENKQLHARCGDLEVAVVVAKKEAQDAKDAVAVAHDINAGITASKDEAIKREGVATKQFVAREAEFHRAINDAETQDATIARLKIDLSAATKSASVAEATAQKERLAAQDLSEQLKAFNLKYSALEQFGVKEIENLRTQMAAAQGQATESKQRAASFEVNNNKLSSELNIMSNDLNGKISQLDLEKKQLEDRLKQKEGDLKTALASEREVKANVQAMEQKLMASLQEKDTTLSELRVAKSQIEALNRDKKTLEAETKERFMEIEKLKASFLKLEQERALLDQSLKDATVRSNELNQQLLDVQHKLRVKVGECETLSMRVADLENQINEIPTLKKENLEFRSKIRDLEDLTKSLKAENMRVSEAETKAREKLRECLVKLEDLKTELTEQKIDYINEIGELKRTSEEKFTEACAQRDDFRAELDRYYALPNIVGVGLGLEQTTEALPTGGTVRTTKICGMAPGLSADLSGALKIGDDLLEVDGIPCVGLTLDDIKAKMSGKRGTKTTIRVLRDTTDDGVQDGDIFNLTLKRGAWGPEHCVLEPEVFQFNLFSSVGVRRNILTRMILIIIS
jgi:C-terminal processing protease CtpA/Prc